MLTVIEQTARKKTISTPAEWETVIQGSFKKNNCTLEVLEHKDIIDFKNTDTFPEYKLVMLDKTEEDMTEEETAKKHSMKVLALVIAK